MWKCARFTPSSLRCVSLMLLLWAAAALAPAAAQEPDAATSEAQPAEEAPKREPITRIQGAPPAESLEQRMERFKREKGAGSDKPFEGFATQAEAEMQRQREAAIASPAELEADAAEVAVESRIRSHERLQDKLADLGAWGGSGCVEIEPAWNAQDDFIRHRKLRADDFLFAKDKSVAAVSVPGAPPTGFAAIALSCEIEPLVQQASDGSYIARITRVRYFAVMSRKESWLAEHAESRAAFLIGHQQLHFDMAEEFARWLNTQREAPTGRLLGVGRTPQLALGMLQLRWAEHMLAVHEDFDTLETAFDRDTKHGRETEKQTEWVFKLGDGFEALTKGVKLETRAKAKAR
jgi:hypothetical protein